MTDFNAKKAKLIVDGLHIDELHTVLADIKSEAEKGKTVLHIYISLNDITREELIKKGFRVISQPSICIQMDGLYYSVYWA